MQVKPNYELRVGLFALFALIVFVWGWTWLKSFNLFHIPQRFIVQFHDVAGLNNNATVNINGVRVGTVDKVALVTKGEVRVYIRVTADNVVVSKGSTVTIQTLGLVGAKYVEITLPAVPAGQQQPPALTDNDVVVGQDPVRVELVVNDIATRLARIFKSVKGERAGTSLAEALEHSGEAVRNINEASAKLNKNMDRFANVADSVRSTSEKIGAAADRAQGIETSANTFFVHGSKAYDNVGTLATDLRGTGHKIDRILDNPRLTGDLKETVELARQTADKVAAAIHDLGGTLRDEPLRKDVLEILNRVDKSTDNIQKSLSIVKGLSADQGLRSDLKEVVGNAREAMGKLDGIISEPGFKSDIRTTIGKVHKAADDVDYASRQLSNILGKRAPLLHAVFGRPGNIPRDQKESGDQNK